MHVRHAVKFVSCDLPFIRFLVITWITPRNSSFAIGFSVYIYLHDKVNNFLLTVTAAGSKTYSQKHMQTI